MAGYWRLWTAAAAICWACVACSSGGGSPPPPTPRPGVLPEVPPPPRPDPRARNSAEGSCDGVLDYGDDLRVAGARVVGRTHPDASTVELDLELDLQNTGNARFHAASATIDPSTAAAAALGVVASPAPLPADFGAIAEGGLATSPAALRVRLPADREGELLSQLRSGALPLRVDADEENVYADHVRFLEWDLGLDWMYWAASNLDPGPPPYPLGKEWGMVFFHPLAKDVPTVFDRWEPGTATYMVEDPASPGGGPLVHIPPGLRKVRILEAEKVDPRLQNYTMWRVKVRIPNDEPLPEIYKTASHCSGKGGHIDPAVQSSRVYVLDGDPVLGPDRDTDGQPIRANELLFSEGMLSFSGQFSGHALKPSLSIKLRDGFVDVRTALENELSLTAEVRATARVPPGVASELEPIPVTLWELCFPLPSLSFGPLETPRSIRLAQTLGMEGTIAAGVRVGMQKRFVNGVEIHCTRRPGEAAQCGGGFYERDTPLEVTPPDFTESTGFELRPTATFEVLAHYGDQACKIGPGFGIDTRAYGKIGQSPAQDPWWVAAYGIEAVGFVEMKIAGLDIARYEAPLWTREQRAGDSGTAPSGAARARATLADPAPRRSGEDQRWSVAIDDTSARNGVDQSRIAVLPDGSALVVATEPVGGRIPLVKLDRYGAFVWAKELSREVLRIRALPDGTALLVGAVAWMGRVDADGNLLWSRDVQLGRAGLPGARCTLADAVALEQAPGVYDYVGVGTMGTGLVTQPDACAFRLRPDGTLSWSRIYVGEQGESFSAATPTRDGNVAAAGVYNWQWVGKRTVPLFARIDAATGDLEWAKRLPMTRIARIHDLAEAADGTLFAAGGAEGTILTTGAALLARISADGSDGRHGLFFEDADWEARLDEDWLGLLTFAPWVDTPGGDTAYDGFRGLAPSGDGMVAVGFTGLGTGTSARAVKVNASLGVEWMTVFDTAGTDSFSGVARTADALLVTGHSEGLPQPGGGSGDGQIWVLKLPLTGSVDFLPSAGVTRRYLSPGVRSSHDDPVVNPSAVATLDAPFTAVDPLLVSSEAVSGLVIEASPYCALLLTSTGHPSVADGCPD